MSPLALHIGLKLMILLVSTTIDLTWAFRRANRLFTFKVPKPNTKTTKTEMRLKPQAVQEGGKKTACSECRPNMRVADCPTV